MENDEVKVDKEELKELFKETLSTMELMRNHLSALGDNLDARVQSLERQYRALMTKWEQE